MSGVDWKSTRVLVTGGTGFLGRYVCAELRKRGAGFVSAPESRDYDLTQQADAELMVKSTAPDVLIHLAAEVGGIGANRANPGRYFYANMAMALNTIEAARKYDVRKYVQLGTVCAYPKDTPVPFKEDDLWNGYPEETNAPYGIAKKAALVMLQGYRQQYGLEGIYLLPVNLYGPGDNFDPQSSHVIPALIRKFVIAKELRLPQVLLWGSGEVSREFLFAEDCASAIVQAAERYNGDAPINIGTGKEIRIRDLAARIRKLVDYDGEIVWDREMPDGQPRRCLDTRRAAEEFGFRAKTPLLEGLRSTVNWWWQNRSDTSRARRA